VTAQAIGALTRAGWLQARSYRLTFFLQIASLLMMVVPIYFIAGALQPTMAGTIAVESDQYFAFVLVGSVALMFISTAMTTLPTGIAGGISSGYFEALLMTRAPLPAILVGLSSYGHLHMTVRGAVMLAVGALLGAQVAWTRVLPGLFILALLVVAHWGIGLMSSALVIAFRTPGPLTQIVSMLSVFFGGVYYPVSAIPSWLGVIASVTPLAYGLRALRRVLLQGESLVAVGADLAALAAGGAVLLLVGSAAIKAALQYARRSGTLGTY